MRKTLTLITFNLLLVLPGFGQEDHSCKGGHQGFILNHHPMRQSAPDQTDIIYLGMHIELDPAVNHIAGIITYHFKAISHGVSSLELLYDDHLPLHYIRRGDIDLSYSRVDGMILIDLGKELEEGQWDTITISYEADGILDHKMHNGVPVISTNNSNYLKLWYPGKQSLVDKIDSVDVYVTTPMGQYAAGNGRRVSIIEDNGKIIHHWKHRHPIATTYLLNVAVTNYVMLEESMMLPDGDTLALLHYVYPEQLTAVQQELSAVPDIMRFFIEKFGPYPFADEKYGHAQFSDGGALEVQTMSFMGYFNFNVIAHELAHQWFGNFVTFGSLADMWLSEGWAEYLSGLAVEQLRPGMWTSLKNSKISSVTSQPGGSVYVSDTTDINRIFDGRLTYNKGFYLTHMLRWVMGDSLFFEAAYQYLHDPDHIDGFARVADLQEQFESTSGLDLDEFFADWYYGEGYPSYTIDWIQEQDSVILWVSQSQSHPSVSFFEMPIHLIAYRFVVVADTVFQHTFNNQRFAFYVGNTTISQLLFDNDKWILSKNNKVTKLTTALPDSYLQKRYIAYPNPARDQVSVSLPELFHERVNVTLLSAEGRELKRFNDQLVTASPIMISLRDLASGLYYIIIDGKDITYRGRVVVE